MKALKWLNCKYNNIYNNKKLYLYSLFMLLSLSIFGYDISDIVVNRLDETAIFQQYGEPSYVYSMDPSNIKEIGNELFSKYHQYRLQGLLERAPDTIFFQDGSNLQILHNFYFVKILAYLEKGLYFYLDENNKCLHAFIMISNPYTDNLDSAVKQNISKIGNFDISSDNSSIWGIIPVLGELDYDGSRRSVYNGILIYKTTSIPDVNGLDAIEYSMRQDVLYHVYSVESDQNYRPTYLYIWANILTPGLWD